MYKSRILCSILFMLATISAFSADIIVESRADGQNYSGYKETAGHWLSSNTPAVTAKSAAPGLSPQTLGSRKTTVTPKSGKPADAIISAARFTPPFEVGGDYNVYVTFPKAANATPITVFIKSAKGEETKTLTQDGWGATGSPNGDRWLDIGKFTFSKDGDQYVELRVTGATGATDPRNPPQAFADAVRFSTEPISTSATPAAAIPGKTPAAIKDTDSAAAPAPNATAAPANNGSTIDWVADLPTARAEAGKSDKKVFVYFYSPQSSRSADYEKQVINDSKVQAAIKAGYVAVKINMDTDRQLSAQLQVFRAGTINIYDAATGGGLVHISDTPEVDELVKRLTAVK